MLAYLNIFGVENPSVRILTIALAFFIAFITYAAVERKVRINVYSFSIPRLTSCSLLIAFLAFCYSTGVISVKNSESSRIIEAAVSDWDEFQGFETKTSDGISVYQKPSGKHTTVFYGDSHMAQYSSRISHIISTSSDSTNTASFIIATGCLPVLGFDSDRKNCSDEYKQRVRDYLLHSEDISTVVIAAAWSRLGFDHTARVFSNGKWVNIREGGLPIVLDDLSSFLQQLAATKKVYLVVDNPVDPRFDPKVAFMQQRLQANFSVPQQKYPYDQKQDFVRRQLLLVANKTGVNVVDPIHHFCDEQGCSAFTNNGQPKFRDKNHIRSSYAKEYIRYLDQTLISPESSGFFQ